MATPPGTRRGGRCPPARIERAHHADEVVVHRPQTVEPVHHDGEEADQGDDHELRQDAVAQQDDQDRARAQRRGSSASRSAGGTRLGEAARTDAAKPRARRRRRRRSRSRSAPRAGHPRRRREDLAPVVACSEIDDLRRRGEQVLRDVDARTHELPHGEHEKDEQRAPVRTLRQKRLKQTGLARDRQSASDLARSPAAWAPRCSLDRLQRLFLELHELRARDDLAARLEGREVAIEYADSRPPGPRGEHRHASC